mgnify:CR=1 FL=1
MEIIQKLIIGGLFLVVAGIMMSNAANRLDKNSEQ